eukprot:1154679-Pelagomonas_calceolata.AAC.1
MRQDKNRKEVPRKGKRYIAVTALCAHVLDRCISLAWSCWLPHPRAVFSHCCALHWSGQPSYV